MDNNNPTATAETSAPRGWKIQSLDAIEQLSIYVFSEVSQLYPEIGAAIVRTDRECATPFWEELDAILRKRLREIEPAELERAIRDASS